MESELRQMNNEIIKIRIDLDIIKGLLMPKVDDEGELSDWAKKELAEARKETKRISVEDLKKEIENEL